MDRLTRISILSKSDLLKSQHLNQNRHKKKEGLFRDKSNNRQALHCRVIHKLVSSVGGRDTHLLSNKLPPLKGSLIRDYMSEVIDEHTRERGRSIMASLCLDDHFV